MHGWSPLGLCSQCLYTLGSLINQPYFCPLSFTIKGRQKRIFFSLDFLPFIRYGPSYSPINCGVEPKKYDKAKEYYQKVLKINPKFPPAANNLAYLYAEGRGNIDEALNLAQSAKQQVPDDPHISDTLGWIYYKKNIFTRAVVYLKEANEKISDNASMRYHLGMAYYRSGDKENAKKELRKSLELDSRFSGADEARAPLKLIQ